jgi:MFS transporter, ACS family, allantoate permease
MTGMWYTREEQAARLGLWYSGVGLATIIGSPIAWGLDSPSASTGSLSSWQLLYVVFGAVTFALAICFYFIVPDSQLSANFLTPAERVVAINRIRVNQQGIGNRKFKTYQAIEVLKDPRTYLYFSFQFIANIGYGAVGTFGSLMLVSLGFKSRTVLIMTLPHGATTFVGVIGCCYFASRMNDRTLWAGISALFGIVFGACLYGLENNKWGSVIAFYVSFEIPIHTNERD